MSEETRQAIDDADYTNFIEELAVALRSLWEIRFDLAHLNQFDVIGDVARDAFWSGGLLIRPAANDEATVHVWEPGEVDPATLGLQKSW